jgi:predicted metal-binding protein
MEKYIQRAKELKMEHAVIITPDQIAFDVRALLKCRWGCENYFLENNIRCHTRGTTYEERVEMVKRYSSILLMHSHDVQQLTVAVLEIEKIAFLDGYYFPFALRSCTLCDVCNVLEGKGNPCPHPEKIRPCDQSFGIDVYKTARSVGLPCEVLQDKDDLQNRYGFVLIE